MEDLNYQQYFEARYYNNTNIEQEEKELERKLKIIHRLMYKHIKQSAKNRREKLYQQYKNERVNGNLAKALDIVSFTVGLEKLTGDNWTENSKDEIFELLLKAIKKENKK